MDQTGPNINCFEKMRNMLNKLYSSEFHQVVAFCRKWCLKRASLYKANV